MMTRTRVRIRAAKEAVMRRLLVLLGLFACSPAALAGEFEFPTLRGSENVPSYQESTRWRGWYAGGHLGLNNTFVDATTVTQPLVADMLRELALENEQQVSQWVVLGKGEARSMSYGGFVGYNYGWEEVILGVEAGWSKLGASVDAPVNPLTRATSAGGNNYLVTSTGTGSLTLYNFGTLKGRVGWDAGNFMPYATVGGAVAQTSYARSATVSGTQTDSTGTVTPFSFSESEAKGSAWIYGITFGAGVDIMVMPHVFFRAEYEFVAFAPVANFTVIVNTGRVGLGFKF
jgi:outer membrane immunogenic protein